MNDREYKTLIATVIEEAVTEAPILRRAEITRIGNVIAILFGEKLFRIVVERV